MSFFSGRVSCARFRVTGRPPRSFGPDHLHKLSDHAIGKQRIVAADGVEVGWTAGDHILDTRFDLAKNVVNDALYFALRVDAQKVPSDLLRAYTQVELEGLAAKPIGNLYFAGETTDAFYSWQGFMEGGALSGLRAAAEVSSDFR